MAEHDPAHNAGTVTLAAAPPAGHVVPARVLLAVWTLLIVLTAATVWVTHFDLGRLNLWIALGIATVKAAFVLLYFMHLRYDHPLNAMWFIFALFFVALFLGGTLTDTEQYQAQLIPGYAPAMTEQSATRQ